MSTRCPASFLWLHADVTVYCDREARARARRGRTVASAAAGGIDIGGTKIAVAARQRDGRARPRSLRSRRSPSSGFASGVSPDPRRGDPGRRGERDGRPRDLHGIGIGCAGPVDPVRGIDPQPVHAAGLAGRRHRDAPARGLRLPGRARERRGHGAAGRVRGRGRPRVRSGGDADLRHRHRGRRPRRGYGSLRGAAGEHPELGHVPVDPRGPACYCGTSGCFESLASGPRSPPPRAPGLATRPALARARAGDGGPALRGARWRPPSPTWTILHTLLPERLILGGGMMDAHYDAFAAAVRGDRAGHAPPGTSHGGARASSGSRARRGRGGERGHESAIRRD